MRIIKSIRLRIRSLFRRNRIEEELNAEMRDHLERQIRSHISAGMSPGAARNAALREFGNVALIQEQCRDMRHINYIEDIFRDIIYALRSMRRAPGYTVAVLLTLAVGIGASTAMFGIANGIVLQPLPYPEPDRLVRVYDTFAERGAMSNPSSPANFADWRERQQSFTALASYHDVTLTYTGAEPAQALQGTAVSAELAEVLRTPPALGRSFTRDDEQWGNHRVLILSHGLWQRQFGGDPDIVGRAVSFEGAPYTVVGVMPRGFTFPTAQTELWTPLAYDFDVASSRGVHYISVIGRLRPGATLASAGAEMDLLMQQMKQQWPKQLRGYGVWLVSLHESIVGDVRDRVLLFLGAVGIVLLVACVNVANLGMAHAVTRFRELAVRAAMGAGRWRLVSQLGFEGITMALAAGVAGILIAAIAISAVLSAAPLGIPRLDTVRLDPVALAFAIGLSLLIGLLVGIVPALRAARRNLFGALREGGRSETAGPGTMRLRSGFVVAQVALAIVLSVGAGLLVKSFSRLSNVDAGIRTDGVLAATVDVPMSRYPDAAGGRFFLDYVDRLRQVPGVEAAAVSTQLPLEGFCIGFNFWREGQNLPASERPVGDFRVVSPGYFETAGIRLLRGRTFDERDRRESPPVVVIDEALARQQFGNDDPIGQRIHISYGKDAVAREIIGVVADVRQRALDVPPAPGYYLPLTQVTWSMMRVIVRSSLGPAALADAMRRELAAMDPLIPLRDVSTLDDLFAASVRVPRFSMLLFGAFAAMTLLLAATGIYSVMSYTVAQRTSEIGLRMALGAQRATVVGEVVRKGLLLVVLGLILGLAGAFGLTRTLTSFLFGVQPTDPATFASVSALLLFVAILASYIPARRAANVDPVSALRAE